MKIFQIFFSFKRKPVLRIFVVVPGDATMPYLVEAAKAAQLIGDKKSKSVLKQIKDFELVLSIVGYE